MQLESTPAIRNSVRRNNIIRLLAVVVFLITAITILLKVNDMLPSFLLAFVIFYLFGPFVNYFERKGFSRSISVLFLFLISIGLITLGVVLVLPIISKQISTLQEELPRYIEGISQAVETTQVKLNVLLNSVYEIDFSGKLKPKLLSWSSGVFTGLPQLAQKFFTVLVLAPFFAFFMLLDGRQAGRNLLSLVPNNLFELALNLMHQLSEQMGDFIRARLLEAAIVGFFVWIGLEIMGFKFAPLLALFAALTNLIPYLGPIIGMVPAFIVAFINNGGGVDYALLAGVYGFAQLIDMLFIIPLVVAKIVDLHPVTVVIVIIIGAQLLGILGMIISIPVASAMKLIINSVFVHVVDFRR